MSLPQLLLLSSILVISSLPTPITAFVTTSPYDVVTSINNQHHRWCIPTTPSRFSNPLTMMMARYGPQDDIPPLSPTTNKNQLKSEFTSLLNKILSSSTPEEEYPSLFTQNIEMILSVLSMGIQDEVNGSGADNELSLLEEIIKDVVHEHGTAQLDRISEAVNLMLSFVETFVEQTKSMDDVYKQLLGKIFQSIAPGGSSSSAETTNDNDTTANRATGASATETNLDNLLSQNKEAFTPGFLRHVEGECERISTLKSISPESSKMLQVLRVIQTRVLEELGKGIGEGAIVLGQLLGYDDENERLAVLDAGLAVRGMEFARELALLTEEALEGFKAVMAEQGNGNSNAVVDLELVKSVEVIDERIRVFIGKSETDFQ